MIKITVKGVDKVQERLVLLPAGIRAGIAAAIIYLKGKIAIYPPATDANAPGRVDSKGHKMGWYIRGRGGYSASGKKTSSSETLGRKWTTATMNDGYAGVVGNNVSYAKYVHDSNYQAAFHAARGWKTVQDTAETEKMTIAKIIKKAILDAINKKR